MSIIEKAMSKLGNTEKKSIPPTLVESGRNSSSNLIEMAVRNEEAKKIIVEDHVITGNHNSPAPLATPVSEPRSVISPPIIETKQPQVKPVVTKRVSTPQVTQHEPSVNRIENINLAKLRQAGMITPDSGTTQIAEEFRVIKRPLLMNALNQGATPIENGNLIMITSAFPREGKSFCAINLAMSIAMELDHTVLLVDADVAKPSIPGFLGLKSDKGLMDVLLDENLQLDDVLIKTNVEKLTILPAGRPHQYATELLASEAMTRLLQEMAQRYHDRIIIFDSPPILVTTESRVLASLMGQIVVVVEAENTTHDALKEALTQISSCDVVSILLNKGTSKIGTESYGSYGRNGK